MPSIIAPSILSADFARLGDECKRTIEAGADWLHVDIMDGHFVPNLTIGPPVVKALRRALPDAFLDCHLMVSEPGRWVKDMAAAKADMFTFHVEAVQEGDVMPLIDEIHKSGMKAGISIKPKTGVGVLTDEVLKSVDLVLVMTVEPGFGGQAFMEDCAGKCRELRDRCEALGASPHVEVDGGIAPPTVAVAARLGADAFVSGSGVYGTPDVAAAIAELRRRADGARE